MTRAALLAAGLLAACAPGKSPVPAGESSSALGSEAAITLERTPCFGGCPVYRISVTAEGVVSYEGRSSVRKVGVATKRIKPEQVSALLSELERGGYFSFAPRYTPAEPVCGRYATDSPVAITSVRLGDRSHRIEHDYGCGAAPGALVVLERRIDEALGSSEWTGR
ncbi:MAG TPA: DUF6438 domain-containing protein [Gemmatimonadales bacterium]|nr:DUF6438 domain-containing protein [Gemmatimonadales bacterium]